MSVKAKEKSTPRTVKKVSLKVADGKSITSLRGIIGEGQTVSNSDFNGGAETVSRLVKIGLLVK